MVIYQRQSGKMIAQCTIAIDAELREKAREMKLNLSGLLAEAIRSKISKGVVEVSNE